MLNTKYEKPYILCNDCAHSVVCKMKKEFLTYNLLAAKTREMVHKDGTPRFPDFDLIPKCAKYQQQWGNRRDVKEKLANLKYGVAYIDKEGGET